jgi:hypothetical protein
MTTKHTPGPWKLSVEKNRVIADESTGVLGDIVCEMPQGDYCPESRKRWKANRRLIAAAPEMLKALKKIRKELIASGNWNAPDEDWPANREAISSAILEAEGV